MLLHRGNSYDDALCLECRCWLAGYCTHKAWPTCALFGLDEIFWKPEQVYNKVWIQAVLLLVCHRRSAKETVAAAFLISQPQHPFNTKKWSLWKKVNEEETVTYRIVQGKYPCQKITGSVNALLQLDSSQLSLAVPSSPCSELSEQGYQGSTREVHLTLCLLQTFYQAGPAVWIAHQRPHTLSPAQPRLVLKTRWPTHSTQKMLCRRPVGTCPATVGFFCTTNTEGKGMLTLFLKKLQLRLLNFTSQKPRKHNREQFLHEERKIFTELVPGRKEKALEVVWERSVNTE